MKKLILLASSILFMLNANAVEDLLYHNSRGFGGPQIKFTSIGDAQHVLMGGGGGGFITDNFYWGGAGFGTVSNGNTLSVNDNSTMRDLSISMGYGGFYLGYVKPVASSFRLEGRTLFGFGGMTLEEGSFETEQGFFVVEPAVNFYFSPTEWFHFGVGAGYRFANLDAGLVSNSMFNKPTFNINFNFGEF